MKGGTIVKKKLLFNDNPLYNGWDNGALNEQNFYTDDNRYYLTEEDFCSMSDDRLWTSNVEDIDGGDNFADYCQEFFRMLDEEEYYDN